MIGFAPVLNSTSGKRSIARFALPPNAKENGGYERSLPCRACNHQNDPMVNSNARIAIAGPTSDCQSNAAARVTNITSGRVPDASSLHADNLSSSSQTRQVISRN